jgi:hypothetical protein
MYIVIGFIVGAIVGAVSVMLIQHLYNKFAVEFARYEALELSMDEVAEQVNLALTLISDEGGDTEGCIMAAREVLEGITGEDVIWIEALH